MSGDNKEWLNMEMPYETRDTSPYFFYPMFHPSKHMLSGDAVDAFCKTLDRPSENTENASLYVHIPFCDSFCHMCACYKTHTPRDPEVFTRYIKALKAEIAWYASTTLVKNKTIDFIYFGGGTPSTLPPGHIKELIAFIRQRMNISPEAVINFEGDVRTLGNEARLDALKESGCNRISFGVQTFDPRSRKQTGLVPKFRDIENCIRQLRDYGYTINFDLMFGLPGQDLKVWQEDLSTAVDLGADGLDLYETVIYPTTKLFRFRHRLKFADDQERTEMLRTGISHLEASGFIQRTKAIFQKPGNILERAEVMYHAGSEDIIAIGDSAIGFLNGFLYRNLSPLENYLGWAQKNEARPPLRLGKALNRRERLTRNITRLAKCLKLDRDRYTEEIDFFQAPLAELGEKKLIKTDDREIRLTALGRLWTDNIIADFISFQERKRAWKIMY